MPVFASLSTIFNIICGLILLGEASRYKTGNLIGISFAVLVTVSGIFVLGAKKNYIANAEKKEKEEATENDHLNVSAATTAIQVEDENY